MLNESGVLETDVFIKPTDSHQYLHYSSCHPGACKGSIPGEYKTKTEDLRPKNEDPVKLVLKSLKKGSNMILDRSRNKEHQDLQLSTNLTRVFVLYITPPKVQNEDPVKIVLKSLEITRKRLEHNSRSKQKQGATRFAFMNKFDQGLRFVHNPTKKYKTKTPSKLS